MDFQGFNHEDFNVFTIDGLEPRMEQIRSVIRPKLETLGDHFATVLTSMTGEEIYSHVAKHARRTVNPPDDTWVAFANNPRGYKKHPHFQIGMWQTHVFAWFAVINETRNKDIIGEKFLTEAAALQEQIPDHFVWSTDHTKPEAAPNHEISVDELTDKLNRLKDVKKAEILCGIHIPRKEAVSLSGGETLAKLEEAFKTLMPLYEEAKKAVAAS